ncbi:hypothetical protein O181_085157 [Austropuccinia psidii MF-1]|uniref:Uncharacterized protein n=1 Tax=Austropuccinia psidii MF-1 TaxID=1389203 RepID=A0A9Q3ILH2_9BASI|nr:hypothetical protein [Austropuccinia psidii MF-1]
MVNCTLWVLYGLLTIATFHWQNMDPNPICGLRPYPASIGIIGQFSTSLTPRPLSLFLGLGSFQSSSGLWPLVLTLYIRGHGPFRPPTASMAHNLRTQSGHKSVRGLWKPSEATRSAPRKDSPPVQGKTSLSTMHSALKDQEWCIYGIIYHYAPFLLRNLMVTLSEPNYVIPNQVPSPSPFSKKDFSAIQSGNSLAATRRPFEDPNHLALQSLGCHLLIRTIIRAILRGYQSFQSLSRHQILIIPWTTQLVHTGSNQEACMALAQLGQFIFHCGNPVTQFSILKMARTVLTHFRQYSRMIHLPGSASQFFTYTGHLSSPGDFFPS